MSLSISGCPDSRPEWMELGGGCGGVGGAVCYAPSRLGKLVLRVTGFPRISKRQQQHEEHQEEHQSQLDAHHHETRHLYLGFQHPWDRDLWRGWLKQVGKENSKLTLEPRSMQHINSSLQFFSIGICTYT